MARFGFNVLKRCPFRGGIQHFGNTYYYSEPGSAPNNATLELVLDELVTLEKAMHANSVTFVHGRCWSQVGSPGSNNMLVDKALSGNGTRTGSGTHDKERAFLVRFRAGTDSRGRPVYLRKYWHLDALAYGGENISQGAIQNTSELTSTQRAALVTDANAFKLITKNTIPFTLVSKGGREITGATEAHRFYEHRQLGDEWRG